MPYQPAKPRPRSQTAAEPMTDLVCSAKACQQQARWALRWNNPKLHQPQRRKTWLACDDHRQHLAHFLTARSFLRETIPVTELQAT